jgi:hypothetical protein
MVTDAQVRLLRKKLKDGKPVPAAAAAAGMSERSAHNWKDGPLPSQTKKDRHWRTRKDPFEDVWEADVVPLLVDDDAGQLDGTTILEHLRDKHGERFGDRHLRTLQRRVRDWRALRGPEREVFFQQEHPPGREAAFDFTGGTELGVTIQGVRFVHLLFELVLSYSHWRCVSIAFTETFEAMVSGIQDALWKLGGQPYVLRHDNLTAATQELRHESRKLTTRYKAFLDHHGLQSTRIVPGEAHQNGVAEQAHHRLKRRLGQALLLRGSRDFSSVEKYMEFVQVQVAALNAPCSMRFAEERLLLRPLPATPFPEYSTFTAKVRRWSTIHFASRTYSVPSRLIGCTVTVHRHANHIDVLYKGQLVERLPRLRGEHWSRIDYRHIIWSLVKKPGAFERYRFREELFPSPVFRRAYDALVDQHGSRANVEYVRILHLAASTTERDVERELATLLGSQTNFDYAMVKERCSPERSELPELTIDKPNPARFDELLVGGAS